MLDIGWSEFLVIGVIALIVIGPRELPGALRTAGRYAGRVRALAREFRDGLDDIARESELKELKEKIGVDEPWSADEWLDANKKSADTTTATKTAAEDNSASPPTAADEAALDAADVADAETTKAADAPKDPDQKDVKA